MVEVVRSLDCGMGTAPIEQSELRTTSPTRALVVKMGARGGDFRAHMRAIAAAVEILDRDSGVARTSQAWAVQQKQR